MSTKKTIKKILSIIVFKDSRNAERKKEARTWEA